MFPLSLFFFFFLGHLLAFSALNAFVQFHQAVAFLLVPERAQSHGSEKRAVAMGMTQLGKSNENGLSEDVRG